MSTDAAPPARSRLVAAILSGLVPGLGHSWLGRPGRGAAWIAVLCACSLAWIAGLASTWTWARLGLVPLLIAALAVIVDAARLARGGARRFGSRTRAWASHAAFVLGVGFVVPSALALAADGVLDVVVQPDATMVASGARTGDRVVCRRWPRPAAPPVGAVVGVEIEGEVGLERRLLRVAALPGESFAVRRGVVVRDGREWVDDLRRRGRSRELRLAERRLDEGEIAVLDDARTGDAGAAIVPRERIECVARYVLVPGDFDPLRFGAPVR